jgi:translation initiation factor 2 subunit 1
MLYSGEISRRRVNFINRLVKEGKEEVLRVLRVDTKNNYIDLSKKSVKTEEVEECKEKYQKSKTVHGIMRELALKTGKNIEDLYTSFCWPLYKEYGHAYYAFKKILNEEEDILSKVKLDDDIKKHFLEILKQRMVTQPVKIRTDFLLKCLKFEGIDAIKYALLEGEKQSTEEIKIKFKVIGSPSYECTVVTINKNEGIKVMKDALKVVKKCIEEKGGSFILQRNPTVLDEGTEKNIQEQIDSMKKQFEDEEEEEEDNKDEGDGQE